MGKDNDTSTSNREIAENAARTAVVGIGMTASIGITGFLLLWVALFAVFGVFSIVFGLIQGLSAM